MNNLSICGVSDRLTPENRGEPVRCQLSAIHVHRGTLHRWVHSDRSSGREWEIQVTTTTKDERRDRSERMTMGDIAQELISLGAPGTRKQVHGRVRAWRIRGKLPEPDASVGTTPYWRRGTVLDWLTAGGHL